MILSRFEYEEIIVASNSLWRYFSSNEILTKKEMIDHLSGYE